MLGIPAHGNDRPGWVITLTGAGRLIWWNGSRTRLCRDLRPGASQLKAHREAMPKIKPNGRAWAGGRSVTTHREKRGSKPAAASRSPAARGGFANGRFEVANLGVLTAAVETGSAGSPQGASTQTQTLAGGFDWIRRSRRRTGSVVSDRDPNERPQQQESPWQREAHLQSLA